jgi:NADPH-ferrihemoprotein reductase
MATDVPQYPTYATLMPSGLAPFRGFLQDRHYHLRKGFPISVTLTSEDRVVFSGECVGDTVLYYGCRTSNHEFLYKEEIMHYYKEKVITKLYELSYC